jgi:predicted transcriptional regulator
MLDRPPSPDEIDAAADDDAADEDAIAEYNAKGGISHAAIMAWVGSWGTKDERPPPEIGD